MTNGDDLAYPIQISTHGGMGTITEIGLTKREYFAAMALASGSSVKDSVLKADALINELNKQP